MNVSGQIQGESYNHYNLVSLCNCFKDGSIWTEITAEIFKTSRGVAIITGTNVAQAYDTWTNVGWANVT